jgi:ribonucleoside-diphosphate reductase alpha chain
MRDRYWWLTEESRTVLDRGYLLAGERPEDAVDRIAVAAAVRLGRKDYVAKFRDLIEYGWMSLSTPIWCNMGTERGLPISCFGLTIDDSIESIADSLTEVITQTKVGGGTSAYFGNIRPRGSTITNNGQSGGSVSFMRLYDTAIAVVSQGTTRRGNMAAYQDITHADIGEFLNIKDVGSDIQNLFYGVNITDAWMEAMIDGDKEKRRVWARVLESRRAKGLPYLHFVDTANRLAPAVYRELNRPILASNLCCEIELPASTDESFVCCLASMNLELYEDWAGTDAVRTAIYFLDAVMSEFIDKARSIRHLERATRFATNHRALGLGVLGYHSYLQSRLIPFESLAAKNLNRKIFRDLKAEALLASRALALEYGEPALMTGRGLRNTTLLSVAPTTSSSSILGQTSQGIEPLSSNYFKVGLAKGNFIRKNKWLVRLLEEKGANTDETWSEIMSADGSVQGLRCLTADEKEVFRTFKETSQLEIISQAADRQEFICQGQSLNLNIPPSVDPREINRLYLEAWRLGVKGLYYQRSQSVSQEFIRILNCAACAA